MSKFHSGGNAGRFNTGGAGQNAQRGTLMTKDEHDWFKAMVHVNSPIRKRLRRSRFKTEYDTSYETYGEWYDPDVWCRAPKADSGCSWDYSEERQLGDITRTGNVEYGNFYNKLTKNRLKHYTQFTRFFKQTGITKGMGEFVEKMKDQNLLVDDLQTTTAPQPPKKTKRKKWMVVETKPLQGKLPTLPIGGKPCCQGNCQCNCKPTEFRPAKGESKCGSAKKAECSGTVCKAPSSAPPPQKYVAVKKEPTLPEIDKIHIGMQMKDGSSFNIKAMPENAVLTAK